jgi:hypothetical protein
MSDGNKYDAKLATWMSANLYGNGIAANNAESGKHTWNQNVQLWGTVAGADADLRDAQYNIICQTVFQVNDPWEDYHNENAEAIIRTLLTADPTKRIIVVLAPKVDATRTVVQPIEAWQLAEWNMYQTYPNCICVNMRQECEDHPEMTSTYMADELHFADAGHVKIKDIVVADWTANPTKYTDDRYDALPARTFDCEKYEYPPTMLRGDQCTSKSGTGWAVKNTTGWESSTAGDEIIFDFTGVSFGVYYTSGAVVSVSVDGGDYVDTEYIGTNGIPLSVFGVSMVRGAHQVKLKVVSGTLSVTQFWAK